MMKHIFVCLVFVIYFLPSVKADGGAMIGIIVGVGLAIIFVISLGILGCYCYRKRLRLKESNNYAERTAEEHSSDFTTQRRVVIPLQVPPPSYSLTDPQSSRSSGNNSISHIHSPKDQPPPYSANVGIYHTCASGQPFQGRDNPAFINGSMSSFSDFPSMADILLTSSKTSLPAAVLLEGSSAGRKQNKLSDSAKGTSLESRTFSQGIPYVHDNQRFSLSLEEEPRNVLNECFESYSNSDSETTEVNMTGNWLDSIKNQSSKNHIRPNSQTNQTEVGSSARGGRHLNKKPVASVKSRSKAVVNNNSNAIQQNGSSSSTSQSIHKKTPQQYRKRIESSDSGADMSQDVNMNPKGQKNGQKRLSKISSDSGLGEQSSSTHSKSKNNSKLKWVVADGPSTQHASRSTEV